MGSFKTNTAFYRSRYGRNGGTKPWWRVCFLVGLALAMFGASRLAHEYVGIFGLVELVTFVIVSVIYFTHRNKVLRRKAQEEKKNKGAEQ